MTIRESHPGLTFEEYRDCCVYLSFYQYLCMRYEKECPIEYQLKSLARMAIRGKLQIKSFCTYMEQADAVFCRYNDELRLTKLSFWRRMQLPHSGEKQKSFARFIRKWVKKIYYLEEDGGISYESFPSFFSELIGEFSQDKKEAKIHPDIQNLLEIFCVKKPNMKLFQAEFKYSILLNNIRKKWKNVHFYGFDSQQIYGEILKIRAFIEGAENRTEVLSEEELFGEKLKDRMDYGLFYLPMGMEIGALAEVYQKNIILPERKNISFSKNKSNLALIISMMSYLSEEGELTAVLPRQILYREGKEVQLRQYIIEEKNWLDIAVLLPQDVFESGTPETVLLHFKKKRNRRDVLLIDCDENHFDKKTLGTIEKVYQDKICTEWYAKNVAIYDLQKNHFNLNFSRYFERETKKSEIDLEAKKRQIQKIDNELKEIGRSMELYRRDLSIR